MAERVSHVAIPLGGGFCPGGPDTAQSCTGNGTRVLRSRSAAGPLAARRNVNHHEFHRTSLAHSACWFCRSLQGEKRLGARSQSSFTNFFALEARAPRRNADRETLRRRNSGQRRPGAGE